ncbi:MAG: glycosyltransferase [Chloroflexota bacterium]|nr:glycosyltransferase [Chloroflexota bacterium]
MKAARLVALVSIGDLHWSMGYDYLLAAYARLHQAGILFTARIVGAGSLASELRFSIGDMGLHSIVQIAAPPADPVIALADADMLVIASHRDTLRPPLRAALDRGLTVVTTAFAGIEALPASDTLTTVPIRDMRALTEALHARIASAERARA